MPVEKIAQMLQRAVQHHQAGRLTDAETLYTQILDAEPAHADALHLLGLIALAHGRHDLAIELIETANELRPANPIFLSNLGEAYNRTGRPDQATKCCSEALKIKPDFAAAHTNLGNALQSLGQLDAAEKSFRTALGLDPTSSAAKLNLGLLCLLRGDYAAGLEYYESRLEPARLRGGDTQKILGQLAGIPRWRGEPLQGKRLLLWTEQGLGDTLMTMRYLPLVRARGAGRLLVCCESALVRLMQGCREIDEVIFDAHLQDWHKRVDVQCPMMSLPLVLGTRWNTIPAKMPYVGIPAELIERWSARVAALAPPRIGLVWAGGKKTAADARRSIPLSSFEPLLGLRGVSLVSLQKDGRAARPQDASSHVTDWMDQCDDLLETGALIEQLDLVISVDTAVAHLAGALGKPIWLLNRSGSEWRWMLDRDDSTWYPTMRIFNQQQRDWQSVIQDVADAVAKEFRLAPAPIGLRLQRLSRRIFTRSS